jgi:predicted Fe-Mo cluster-binding NifX family protein
MKNKFAIPIENGLLCSHFGHCQQFAIIEVENNTIVNESFIIPPPHEPGLLPAWLAEKGVTNIIAGGLGQKAIELFLSHRIKVIVGAPQKRASDLVSDYLNNKLVTNANACSH